MDIKTVALSGDQTLHDLHLIIQDAFEWDNDHMYSFFMSNKVWGRASEYSGNPLGEYIPEDSFRGVSNSASATEIRDLNIKEKSVFKHLFDYGDELVHTIEVLEIKSFDKSKNYPILIGKTGKSIEQYPNYQDDDWDGEDFEKKEEN